MIHVYSLSTLSLSTFSVARVCSTIQTTSNKSLSATPPSHTHTHTHILPEKGTVVVVPEVGRQLEVGRLEVGQQVGKLEVGQLVGTVQEVGRQGLELVYQPFLF